MKAVRNVFLIVLMMVLGNSVYALGLGELVLESELNQPLKARVPLLKTGDLTVEQLRVQLASEADFALRKITREFLYQSIHFKVDMKHPSGPCVILSTEKPIKEPSLDFLIELSWPGGKLIRGYTVLLEKPKQ